MCSAHRIIQGKRHSLLNTHDLRLKFFTAHKSQGRNFISQVSIIDGAVKLYVMKGTDTFFGRIHYPLQKWNSISPSSSSPESSRFNNHRCTTISHLQNYKFFEYQPMAKEKAQKGSYLYYQFLYRKPATLMVSPCSWNYRIFQILNSGSSLTWCSSSSLRGGRMSERKKFLRGISARIRRGSDWNLDLEFFFTLRDGIHRSLVHIFARRQDKFLAIQLEVAAHSNPGRNRYGFTGVSYGPGYSTGTVRTVPLPVARAGVPSSQLSVTVYIFSLHPIVIIWVT